MPSDGAGDPDGDFGGGRAEALAPGRREGASSTAVADPDPVITAAADVTGLARAWFNVGTQAWPMAQPSGQHAATRRAGG